MQYRTIKLNIPENRQKLKGFIIQNVVKKSLKKNQDEISFRA